MDWKLAAFGGFGSAAVGTTLGILIALAFVGTEALLLGSIVGGLAGSGAGWTVVSRLTRPRTHGEETPFVSAAVPVEGRVSHRNWRAF